MDRCSVLQVSINDPRAQVVTPTALAPPRSPSNADPVHDDVERAVEERRAIGSSPVGRNVDAPTAQARGDLPGGAGAAALLDTAACPDPIGRRQYGGVSMVEARES